MDRLTTKSILGGWTLRVPRQEAIDRLAAYEETGLEPEEIDSVFIHRVIEENRRLKGFAQAEKDGRLVVLPYKIGDSVYRIAVRRKYLNHSMCTPYIKVIEIKTENALKYKSEVGKTVFLTREEAEAALKKREGMK